MADEDIWIAEDKEFEIRASTWDVLLRGVSQVVEELDAAAGSEERS